jgi:excisionase family DNA binding protein
MSTRIEQPRLLRSKEVALILGCHPATVQKLVHTGKLRSVQFGDVKGWHRFHPGEVERFLAERQGHE